MTHRIRRLPAALTATTALSLAGPTPLTTTAESPAPPGSAPDGARAARQSTPGESYLGRDGHIEYLAGNLPVTFAAPHGGDLRPASHPRGVRRQHRDGEGPQHPGTHPGDLPGVLRTDRQVSARRHQPPAPGSIGCQPRTRRDRVR